MKLYGLYDITRSNITRRLQHFIGDPDVFRINPRYVLFENYTATNFNLPISQLHVPLTVIKENFTAKDFFIIHEQFAESQNGLTDLHSLLSVISQTAVDRDEVKNAINVMISAQICLK